MSKHEFDSLIVGQISLDINVDYKGNEIHEIGGAVLHSSYAASALGHPVCVLPKADPKTVDLQEIFADGNHITVVPLESPANTSIKNVYHTADKERRTCRAISRIEPYHVAEIPAIDAQIYHIAGLMRGDLGNDSILHAAKRALAAVDVQCLLRCVVNEAGDMEFHDWKEKREILPHIEFLKTDMAEAEILTGLKDRKEAARLLHTWGAKEVMITHNTEVLVYDGKATYIQPLRPRNLSGRSGRGDTCFSAYITERLHAGIPEALHIAAALVSLKMETPGPFKGNREDVLEYMKLYYDA
ncbi:MAG: PfkB family carbohydrate kinase [Lachnospiraceae bacterium]